MNSVSLPKINSTHGGSKNFADAKSASDDVWYSALSLHFSLTNVCIHCDRFWVFQIHTDENRTIIFGEQQPVVRWVMFV
jgi:hypothetical protein